jgi:hypothetical protein
VLVAAALGCASGASAGPSFGVADDAGKYADDGGATFFLLLNDLGFTQNRISVFWDPTDGSDGLTIRERGFLDRALPVAAIRGIDVVLDVSPLRAKVFAVDTNKRITLFAQYLQLLARSYPQVTRFIVGNEPNQPRFHQPQFLPARRGGHKPTAAALYARILGASYDALKEVNPEITVIGLGLSPRGNDNPRARNNVSRSPVRFIRDLALAYRRSGRTRPLMDSLGFHPYPGSNKQRLSGGYQWPNAGLANLDRIKQAVWDGFHGTPQPVFAEGPQYGPPSPQSRRSLELVLDEYGRQVTVISSVKSEYNGRENVRTITEGQQANMYAAVLHRVVCDPNVTSFYYFHLVDDPDLDRFQSGLLRVDWTKRPAYHAVKTALADSEGRCAGAPRWWRHTESVVGADVTFGDDGALTIQAEEEATATAGIFTASLSTPELIEGLARRAASARSRVHLVRAYRPKLLDLDAAYLPRGRYVHAVLLRAAMNPKRTFLAVSDPFTVSS